MPAFASSFATLNSNNLQGILNFMSGFGHALCMRQLEFRASKRFARLSHRAAAQRSRKLFAMTETLLNAIAALASIGLSKGPPKG